MENASFIASDTNGLKKDEENVQNPIEFCENISWFRFQHSYLASSRPASTVSVETAAGNGQKRSEMVGNPLGKGGPLFQLEKITPLFDFEMKFVALFTPALFTPAQINAA